MKLMTERLFPTQNMYTKYAQIMLGFFFQTFKHNKKFCQQQNFTNKTNICVRVWVWNVDVCDWYSSVAQQLKNV